MTDRKHSWKHRLREVGIEILIIMFALSMTLLLDRWRENAHERKREKSFLLGLKRDLLSDIDQEKSDSATYTRIARASAYFVDVSLGQTEPGTDSIRYYSKFLFNSTQLVPNDSRFEALKSSGNIDIIEDDSLQNRILILYQYHLKNLFASTNSFNNFRRENLFPATMQRLQVSKDGVPDFIALVRNSEVRNMLMLSRPGGATQEILTRYHMVIEESQAIVRMIDDQYR